MNFLESGLIVEASDFFVRALAIQSTGDEYQLTHLADVLPHQKSVLRTTLQEKLGDRWQPAGPLLAISHHSHHAIHLPTSLPEEAVSASGKMDLLRKLTQLTPEDSFYTLLDAQNGLRSATAPNRSIFLACPKEMLDKSRTEFTELGFSQVQFISGLISAAGGLQRMLSRDPARGPVLLLEPSLDRLQVLVVSAEGILAAETVTPGFQSIVTSIQQALGLKFPGSAAKLYHEGLYDFTDIASSLFGPLADPCREALRKVQETAGVSLKSLYCTQLTASKRWVLEGLAQAMGLSPFASQEDELLATFHLQPLSPEVKALFPVDALSLLHPLGSGFLRDPVDKNWLPLYLSPGLVPEPELAAPAKPAPAAPAAPATPEAKPVAAKGPAKLPPSKAAGRSVSPPAPAILPKPGAPPTPASQKGKPPAPAPKKTPESTAPVAPTTPPAPPNEPAQASKATPVPVAAPAASAKPTPPEPEKAPAPSREPAKSASRPSPSTEAKPAPAPVADTPKTAAAPTPPATVAKTDAPAAKPKPATSTTAAPAKPTPVASPSPRTPAPAKPATTPTEEEEEKKKLPLAMIIGIAAVVLIILGAVFFLGRSKSEPPTAATEAATQPANPPPSNQEALAAQREAQRQAEAEAIRQAEEKARQQAEAEAAARAEAEKLEAQRLANLRGSVVLTSTPSGAEVKLEGQLIGLTPLTKGNLPRGTHVFTLGKRGFADTVVQATIESEAVITLPNVVLPSLLGSLKVVTTPAKIPFTIKALDNAEDTPRIDPERLVTPLEITDLQPGRYEIVFARMDWPEYSQTATVKSREKANVEFVYVGGKLQVITNPPGASVKVGDKVLGTTPLQLSDLDPATLPLQINLDGYEPEEALAVIDPGQTETIRKELLSFDRVVPANQVDILPKRMIGEDPSHPYPQGSGKTDRVLVRALISKDGVPSEFVIRESTDKACADAAMQALTTWRFEPAKRKGQAVKTVVDIPFQFRDEVATPAGATAPTP